MIAAADGSKTSFLGRISETTRAFTKTRLGAQEVNHGTQR